MSRARRRALLLRWVTGQSLVDRVVVSMRRAGWVAANLAAEALGPLRADEAARRRLGRRVDRTRSGAVRAPTS